MSFAVADVKKKWTNIKDSFVKDVKGKKPRKSRGPPEHRKKYYLFDHLQFLIPFVQDSKAGGNGSRSAGNGESRKRARKTGALPAKEGNNNNNNNTSSSSWSRANHHHAVAGKQEMPPDVQYHADALNTVAGKSASDALCQLDGDLSFMVSLLPTVKTMNEQQKINFKIGVLQLLARIKFNDALQQQQPAADMAAYQQYVTPDHLRCFPVPYQPSCNIPFPFGGGQAAAVSSTQQRAATGGERRAACDTPAAVKQETAAGDSSPPTSSMFESDLDEDNDSVADNN